MKISHQAKKFQRAVFHYAVILEIFVYVIAFAVAGMVVWFSTYSSFFFIRIGAVPVSFFVFQLTLLLASALCARCFNIPAPGTYDGDSPLLRSLYMREGLSTLVARSVIKEFAHSMPFPGYWYYRLLGMRIHKTVCISTNVSFVSTYMISIGEETAIGIGAIISGHVVSDVHTFTLGPVVIGKRVLIGAGSIIFSHTSIGDDAVIAAHSVVNPGTHIPAGEVWGGIPAKKIK